MGEKIYYVTTPIYYPSDKLHIGHALTTTMADTLARYKRLRGYDVFFLTGSDEHGQKIQRRAKEAGMEPQQFVDRIVTTFKALWQRLNIDYSDFIRTTEKRHTKAVQALLQKIYDQGDIYKSTYEGWYCTPCETFFTDRQVVDGNCPDCRRSMEILKEESYFFRMSNYAERLKQHILDNPDFIQPVSRRNEMLSFIESGLEDLCISRTTFDWGIPLPMEPRHVTYVWFDALTNYISALGYGDDDTLFKKYWPYAVHLVGKDIVRFHTIIWPIILMAAGIELPRQVYGHGWLLIDGGKMSKSRGNVVDPMVLIDRYGADAIRYFLLREMPHGSDGYYHEEALINRINTDLANDFGNLLSRTTAMIEKFSGGDLGSPSNMEPIDEELIQLSRRVPEEVDACLNQFEFARALAAIWRLVNRANKYIEETAPWNLAKDPGEKPRLETVLYNLAEAVRHTTIMVEPFMPGVPARVWEQLGLSGSTDVLTWDSLRIWGGIPAGTRVKRGEPLFPRIDVEARQSENAGGDNEEETAAKPVKSVKPVPEEKEEEITIEEFARVKLKVAQVLEAEKVPGTDKLVKLKVKVGTKLRTIVAGIALHYQPENLPGKKIVIVANLKPVKLKGILSEGMVLAAVDGEKLSLITPEKVVEDGAQVR